MCITSMRLSAAPVWLLQTRGRHILVPGLDTGQGTSILFFSEERGEKGWRDNRELKRHLRKTLAETSALNNKSRNMTLYLTRLSVQNPWRIGTTVNIPCTVVLHYLASITIYRSRVSGIIHLIKLTSRLCVSVYFTSTPKAMVQ